MVERAVRTHQPTTFSGCPIFASLTGNKTLTLVDLQRIQALGFEVAEVHSRKLPLNA